MNQSAVNYYQHLLDSTPNGFEVEPDPDNPADFHVTHDTGETERHLVKKRYGQNLILHSDPPLTFIEEGGQGDHLAIMPENPNERETPLAVIPLTEIQSVSDPIPRSLLKGFSQRGELGVWLQELSFNLAHRDTDKITIHPEDSLGAKLQTVADENAAYGSVEQVVEAACRQFIEEQERYGEAR